jgi:hypothetical protein
VREDRLRGTVSPTMGNADSGAQSGVGAGLAGAGYWKGMVTR